MAYAQDIQIRQYLSTRTGRGIAVWLFFVIELQQEFLGGEKGQMAELVEVLLVVRHHHVAASNQGTLVLQHVLEILYWMADSIHNISGCQW